MRTFLTAFLCVIFLIGCKEDETIKFCEGMTPDGKEVNCGKVFSLGDLSISIMSKDVFATDKITVNILEKTKFKNEFIESKTVEVKPDENKSITDIRLYKEGVYLIEVRGVDKKKIAGGEVSILDVY